MLGALKFSWKWPKNAQSSIWLYNGYIMVISWLYHGNIMVMSIMVISWLYLGYIHQGYIIECFDLDEVKFVTDNPWITLLPWIEMYLYYYMSLVPLFTG